VSQFVVTGLDGRQYGPVDLATLQQWVRSGSVVRNTPIFDTHAGVHIVAAQIEPLQPLFAAMDPQSGFAPGASRGVNPSASRPTSAPAASPRKKALTWAVAAVLTILTVVVVGFGVMLAFTISAARARLARSTVSRDIALREDPPLAAPAGARAHGPIYFVPVGKTPQADVDWLANYYREHLHVEVEVLPRVPIPDSARIEGTGQTAAQDLLNLLRIQYFRQGATCVIGIADEDINSRMPGTNYLYAYHQTYPNGNYAIISTARIGPAYFGDPPDRPLETSRLRKMTTKMIGFLYYHLPESSDPESPLYGGINGISDIDSRRQAF
jgi:predicted Zn-dependent protease